MKLTTLVYLERAGEYLMLHRTKKENDINREKWIGVGGKFEEGESPEDCMRREVREETGYTVTSFRLRGVVTFLSDTAPTEYMFLYTVDGWMGEERTCDEGELAWIKKEELLRLTMWEGDLIFLRLLEEEHPFFSLKLTYKGDRLLSAVLDGEVIGGGL